MKHFTTYLLPCLLFALMSGGSAKAQDWNYYITDGTEITSNTGLTSGYYIISVWGLVDEGMLYWSDTPQQNSNLLISTTKHANLTNKILDTSETSENKQFIWYIDVDANNTFSIKSVAASKYLSNTGVTNVASGTAAFAIPNVSEGDGSIILSIPKC